MAAKFLCVSIDIAAALAFPLTPQVDFGFLSSSTGIVNTSTSRPVYVSFDGTTLAGILRPVVSFDGHWDNQTVQKVWLRTDPGVGAVVVDVAGETLGDH